MPGRYEETGGLLVLLLWLQVRALGSSPSLCWDRPLGQGLEDRFSQLFRFRQALKFSTLMVMQNVEVSSMQD